MISADAWKKDSAVDSESVWWCVVEGRRRIDCARTGSEAGGPVMLPKKPAVLNQCCCNMFCFFSVGFALSRDAKESGAATEYRLRAVAGHQ